MRCRKIYPVVETFTSQELTNLFSNCHLFDGTQTYPDEEGNPINYPNIGFAPADLGDYLEVRWGAQRFGFPLKNIGYWSSQDEVDQARAAVLVKVKRIIDAFCKANKYKYLTLLKTTDFDYDPITNYNMQEDKTQTNGQETFTHTPVADSGHSKTTNTPAETTQTQTANNPKSEHYTTTYEDAQQNRLAYYDQQSGSVSNATTVDTNGEVEVDYNDPKYTDTKSRDTDKYTLTRKGNIGVMTTQDMILSEREVARFNIIDEFFKDLNSQILLSIWN